MLTPKGWLEILGSEREDGKTVVISNAAIRFCPTCGRQLDAIPTDAERAEGIKRTIPYFRGQLPWAEEHLQILGLL